MITKADFKTERFDGSTIEVRTSIRLSRSRALVRLGKDEGLLSDRIDSVSSESRESIASQVYGDLHRDLMKARIEAEREVSAGSRTISLLDSLIARTDPANFR